jgi:hypothetical protein
VWAATTSTLPSFFHTVDSSAGCSPRSMGIVLTKAPFASVATVNWPVVCWPVLTSTTPTRTSLLAGKSLPVTTSSVHTVQVRTRVSAALAARGQHQQEPGQHQQELGERLAAHQGDASLRQAWLAMV